MGGNLSKSICILHCQVVRNEPHTNTRDLYSFGLLAKFADVTFVNALGPGIDEIEERNFDLVIVSNSFMVMRSSPYWPTLLRRSSQVLGNASRRILFLQDDYHRIDKTVSFAKDMDIQVYSVFAGEAGIYSDYGITAEPWLIGFADDQMDQLLSTIRIDWTARTIDVGQRVYMLPLEFGTEGRRKAELAVKFSEKMAEHGLICDVSTDERDRFSGLEWFKFLSRCRATIGRHSGASLVTKSPFDQARARVVEEVYRNKRFDQQLVRYIGTRQTERPYLAPSPRFFEAASLNVLQILEKSSVPYGIEEWNHFVPVSADLSDSEVVAKFIRSSEAREMVERCHLELFGNPKWQRENWMENLARSTGFIPLPRLGTIKVPVIERDLHEKIATFATRQDRLKIIRTHSKSVRNGKWHPIEATHRWTPIEILDLKKIVGVALESI